MGTVSISELCKKVLDKMSEMNYSKGIIYKYDKIYKRLAQFAEDLSVTEYREAIGEQFLREVYGFTHESKYADLRPMDAVAPAAIRKLSELEYYDCFYRKPRPIITLDWAMDDEIIIHEYKRGFILTDISESSQLERLKYVRKFYNFLEMSGVTSIKAVNAECLSKYLLSLQGYAQVTIKSMLKTLRNYLRYAHSHNHIAHDLSQAVPRMRVIQNAKIPNIWKGGDLEKLLKSIDRANPTGKRNYAVIILTVGLGIRAGDINGLLLSNLNWAKKEIEVIQSKTEVANICPMTDEAGWALIDYLRNGRPQSDLPHVFLTHSAPYNSFGSTTAIQILQSQMQYAGIPVKIPKVSNGMHALRHSLARKLLDQNVDLELLAEIMGHTEIVSSSPYLKVDVTGLRTCALSLEEVRKYAN